MVRRLIPNSSIIFLLIFAVLNANAKYLSLDNTRQIKMAIHEKSYNLDLAKVSQIRLSINTKDLFNSKKGTNSFKINTYEFDEFGNKKFLSSKNTTISQKTKYKILNLELGHFDSNSKNLVIEIFDTDENLIASQNLTINAFNLDKQNIESANLLGNVDCEEEKFDDCNIENLLTNIIKFEAKPQREMDSTSIVKNNNGQYKITIPVPRKKTKTRFRKKMPRVIANNSNNVLNTVNSNPILPAEDIFRDNNNVEVSNIGGDNNRDANGTRLYTHSFVFGSGQINHAGKADNSAKRFLFSKVRSAFRAGYDDQGFWYSKKNLQGNIPMGEYSVAFGRNTIANGEGSFAHGLDVTSSGYASFAMGPDLRTIASGDRSFAFGTKAKATGFNAIAFGGPAEATAINAKAIGQDTYANGRGAIAIGTLVRAREKQSLGIGIFVQGSAMSSYTIGKGIISGSGSKYLNNNKPNSLAIGFNSTAATLFVGPGDGTVGSIGNVGIGTYEPSERLEVNGTVKADKFIGEFTVTNVENATLAETAKRFTEPLEGEVTGKQNSTLVSPSVFENKKTLLKFSSNPGLVSNQDPLVTAISKLDGNISSNRTFISTVNGKLADINNNNDNSNSNSQDIFRNNPGLVVVANTGEDNNTIVNGKRMFTHSFVFGAEKIGDSSVDDNAATKFLFSKPRAAFRAGFDSQGFWGHGANNPMGQFSVGFGQNTLANGDGSFAHGFGTKASGRASFAMGPTSLTMATGDRSFAFGNAKATALNAVAFGGPAEATGINAKAIGQNTIANGQGAMAIGTLVRAKEDLAVGLGSFVQGTSLSSFAIGKGIVAGSQSKYLNNSKPNSLAIGFNSTAATLFVGPGDGTVGSIGRVGIGTTEPSETLEVNGTVKADKFIGEFTVTNVANATLAETAKRFTEPLEGEITGNQKSTLVNPSVFEQKKTLLTLSNTAGLVSNQDPLVTAIGKIIGNTNINSSSINLNLNNINNNNNKITTNTNFVDRVNGKVLGLDGFVTQINGKLANLDSTVNDQFIDIDIVNPTLNNPTLNGSIAFGDDTLVESFTVNGNLFANQFIGDLNGNALSANTAIHSLNAGNALSSNTSLQANNADTALAADFAIQAENANSALTAGSAINFSGLLAGEVTGSQDATIINPSVFENKKTLVKLNSNPGLITNQDPLVTAIGKIIGNTNINSSSINLNANNINNNSNRITTNTNFIDRVNGKVLGIDNFLTDLNGKVANLDSTVNDQFIDVDILNPTLNNPILNGSIAFGDDSLVESFTVNGNLFANKFFGDLNGNALSANTATNFSGLLAGEVSGSQDATLVNPSVFENKKTLVKLNSNPGLVTNQDPLVTAIGKLSGNSNKNSLDIADLIDSVETNTENIANSTDINDLDSLIIRKVDPSSATDLEKEEPMLQLIRTGENNDSGGDPAIRFEVPQIAYTMGLDNSASKRFKISVGGANNNGVGPTLGRSPNVDALTVAIVNSTALAKNRVAVGINEPNPTANLHVGGTSRLDDTVMIGDVPLASPGTRTPSIFSFTADDNAKLLVNGSVALSHGHKFIGDGSKLTNISAENIIGPVNTENISVPGNNGEIFFNKNGKLTSNPDLKFREQILPDDRGEALVTRSIVSRAYLFKQRFLPEQEDKENTKILTTVNKDNERVLAFTVNGSQTFDIGQNKMGINTFTQGSNNINKIESTLDLRYSDKNGGLLISTLRDESNNIGVFPTIKFASGQETNTPTALYESSIMSMGLNTRTGNLLISNSKRIDQNPLFTFSKGGALILGTNENQGSRLGSSGIGIHERAQEEDIRDDSQLTSPLIALSRNVIGKDADTAIQFGRRGNRGHYQLGIDGSDGSKFKLSSSSSNPLSFGAQGVRNLLAIDPLGNILINNHNDGSRTTLNVRSNVGIEKSLNINMPAFTFPVTRPGLNVNGTIMSTQSVGIKANPDNSLGGSALRVGGIVEAVGLRFNSLLDPNNNSTIATEEHMKNIALIASDGMVENSNQVLAWDNNKEQLIVDGSIVIGHGAKADGNGATAIGPNADASGITSFAAGNGPIARGANSVALGFRSEANAGQATSIGFKSLATGTVSLALGSQAKASGLQSLAIGRKAEASGMQAAAFGLKALARGNNSVAIGDSAQADGESSLALLGKALEDSSVAIGASTTAKAPSSIVIGRGASEASSQRLSNDKADSLAIGFNSNVPTLFVGPSAGVGTTGNIGIGTDEPEAKLDVKGSVGIDTLLSLRPSSQPSNARAGDIYSFGNSSEATLCFYNGQEWITLAAKENGLTCPQ